MADDPFRSCVTITQDRYGRGWYAFDCDPCDAPTALHDGDPENIAWHDRPDRVFGQGATPAEALEALSRALEEDREQARLRWEQMTPGEALRLDGAMRDVVQEYVNSFAESMFKPSPLLAYMAEHAPPRRRRWHRLRKVVRRGSR